MGLRAEDVFRPGAFPEYTYISRKSAISDLPYEFRLMQAIKVSGFLTSLVGPSKMGKTILCEKVIGFEHIVEISGADFDEDTDFWKLVSAKAGLAYEGQFASEKQIPSTSDKYTKKETFSLTKDKIIEYYKENDLVLVIDDFHYAPEGKRMQIAQQLKDAIRRGFKAIVVSLMQKGPNTRGRNRNTFRTADGQEHDVYELIVKSIAENPPIMKLEFEDIKERIYRLLADDSGKPSPQMIRESLAKLKELLYGREDIFKVLDWKEGSLYILDPLFLFYLRWGGVH